MNSKLTIEKSFFDTTNTGEKVSLFTLKNQKGLQAKIINFGGVIQELLVPDRNGELADVVLGFNTIETYLKHICLAF